MTKQFIRYTVTDIEDSRLMKYTFSLQLNVLCVQL